MIDIVLWSGCCRFDTFLISFLNFIPLFVTYVNGLEKDRVLFPSVANVLQRENVTMKYSNDFIFIVLKSRLIKLHLLTSRTIDVNNV